MNIIVFRDLSTTAGRAPRAATSAPVQPARLVRRERDFGIGYGNSSGYATERRYVRESFQPRFRCA